MPASVVMPTQQPVSTRRHESEPQNKAPRERPQGPDRTMTANRAKPLTEPVFKKCVRCGYSLRGLPANHACPECGLRFDERCSVYAAPRAPRWYALGFPFFVLAVWVGLDSLWHLPPIAQASPRQYMNALVWFILLLGAPCFLWILIKLVRGGLKIAVMADGLLVNLPGYRNELIPWSNVTGASANVNSVSVRLKKERMIVSLGGDYKVFPTPANAERCAAQINERIRDACGEGATLNG